MSHPHLPLPTLWGQSKDSLAMSSLPAAGLPPLSPAAGCDGSAGSSSRRVKSAHGDQEQAGAALPIACRVN